MSAAGVGRSGTAGLSIISLIFLDEVGQDLGYERPSSWRRRSRKDEFAERLDHAEDLFDGCRFGKCAGDRVSDIGKVDSNTARLGDPAFGGAAIAIVIGEAIDVDDQIRRFRCLRIEIEMQENEAVEIDAAGEAEFVERKEIAQISEERIVLIGFYRFADRSEEIEVFCRGLVDIGAPLLKEVAIDEKMEARKRRFDCLQAPEASRAGENRGLAEALGMSDQAREIDPLAAAEGAA